MSNLPHDEAAYFGLWVEQVNVRVVARFTITGEPASKSRARFTKSGHAYTPQKTKDAEHGVAWAFKGAGGRMCDDSAMTFGVFSIFFCATRQRRDVDNMTKLILDGLNGIAWVDDSQVMEIGSRKEFEEIKEHARTEVVVYQLGRDPGRTFTCIECGKDFATYPSWLSKRHCSRDCMLAKGRRARVRTCQTCGEKFDPGKPSEARFCSRECTNANGRVDVTCDGCGIEFVRQRCFVRARNFCTTKCREAHAAPRRLVGSLGTCVDCGGSTSKKKYPRCRPCRMNFLAANRKGPPQTDRANVKRKGADE